MKNLQSRNPAPTQPWKNHNVAKTPQPHAPNSPKAVGASRLEPPPSPPPRLPAPALPRSPRARGETLAEPGASCAPASASEEGERCCEGLCGDKYMYISEKVRKWM